MVQDIHGRLWNFSPVEDKIKTDAFGLPPLAFVGEYRSEDWANHCHCLLRALGRPDFELRKLSDKDVIAEFESLRGRISGDW